MSYTIISEKCSGCGDCIPVCPVECIHWINETATGARKHAYIDYQTCIDCSACLSVCPTEGAVLDEWHPELQWLSDDIWIAAEAGKLGRISELCSIDPSLVDAKDVNGRTPLLCATEQGNLAVTNWLIAHGAGVNIQDDHLRTPLFQAINRSHFDIARSLLRAGADPNLAHEEGSTPLMRAASMGYRARVEKLFTPQAHLVTDQPECGAEPYLEIASLLIEHGAEVDARDFDTGSTALHIAAGWGHEAMAELLLAHGANVNALDYDGRNGVTPLQEARQHGRQAMAELLLKHGAK